jgi:spore coat protein CotF
VLQEEVSQYQKKKEYEKRYKLIYDIREEYERERER